MYLYVWVFAAAFIITSLIYSYMAAFSTIFYRDKPEVELSKLEIKLLQYEITFLQRIYLFIRNFLMSPMAPPIYIISIVFTFFVWVFTVLINPAIPIILIFLACIVIHRRLSSYWITLKKHYPKNFLFLVNCFIALELINFIWLFGFWVGMIVFVLSFFQIIYSSVLWPFLVPSIIIDKKRSAIEFMVLKLHPDDSLLKVFKYLIISIIPLTILSFIINNYCSIWNLIYDKISADISKVIIISFLIIAFGNILRIVVLHLIRKA